MRVRVRVRVLCVRESGVCMCESGVCVHVHSHHIEGERLSDGCRWLVVVVRWFLVEIVVVMAFD